MREADRRKSEFLAVLAHELRNPLAPLRNGLQILKLLPGTDPTTAQTVSMSVRAFSEGPGGGSRFTVRLPIVEGPVLAALTPTPAPARDRGRRVLVVDDSADAATALAILLRMESYEVRMAADGEEAVEQAAEFEPEIIFMDLGMPRLNGVEAARRIRALPQGQRVRIVTLTGWAQEIDRERTRDAGWTDILFGCTRLKPESSRWDPPLMLTWSLTGLSRRKASSTTNRSLPVRS